MPKRPRSSGPLRNVLGCCTVIWLALLGRAHDRGLSELERQRKKLGLGRTRSADKCANLVRILFPGCAFDTGRYVDARRTRDAQRLQHIVGVKPAGKHKWDTGFDVLEKCPVKRLTQPS